MTRLREEFDADKTERSPVTEYPTTASPFEIPCAVCGRSWYVDDETGRESLRAIHEEFDNKFTCPECEQDYDELAYH